MTVLRGRTGCKGAAVQRVRDDGSHAFRPLHQLVLDVLMLWKLPHLERFRNGKDIHREFPLIPPPARGRRGEGQ